MTTSAAKDVLSRLDNINIEDYKKLHTGLAIRNKLVTDLRLKKGARITGTAYFYGGYIVTDDGKKVLNLRIGDHPANVKNFEEKTDKAPKEKKVFISILFGAQATGKKSQKSIVPKGFTEIAYDEETLTEDKIEAVKEIVKLIRKAVKTGERPFRSKKGVKTPHLNYGKVVADRSLQGLAGVGSLAELWGEETPTEPTDIKEMFARLPVEGLEVKNIFYRTEDFLMCLMPKRPGLKRKWLVLARKTKDFEKFVKSKEEKEALIAKPVYDSQEWWSGIYFAKNEIEIRLYLSDYDRSCKTATIPPHLTRVVFVSPGQCIMYSKCTERPTVYLSTSKQFRPVGGWDVGGWEWDGNYGVWVLEPKSFWTEEIKNIETSFPDGKFVDYLIDEEPGPFAELIYDSLRYSIKCDINHCYAWLNSKKPPKSLSSKGSDLIFSTKHDFLREFAIECHPIIFGCTRPNIEKAIGIIEKRFRPGKRYGIAAGAVDTPAQARARATKTAAAAKIKILRMKRK